jgi:pimeloyl-ACP methyl ester carboxylesterase
MAIGRCETISRGFVNVFGTSMHVRWFGQGIPLLLIHQSPTSARILEPRLLAFGERYLCIELDILGIGQFRTIAEPVPSIELLAKYFIEFLDRIGIQRVLLFGAHTGALICTHMALIRPDRVAGIILDGYPIYTPEGSSQRLATYFPPLTLNWDGSHLVWLWYRYREQFIYWPWNTKRAQMRASTSIPTPQHLHAGVAEMARTTIPTLDVTRPRSATMPLRHWSDLKVEADFLGSDADSLTRKLSLWEPQPGLHTVHKVGEGAEHCGAEVLDDMAARNPDLVTLAEYPGGPALRTRRYAYVPGGSMIATHRVTGNGRPVLVLPPIPAGADFVVSLPDSESSGRALILIDPPGIGGIPNGPMPGCVAAITAALTDADASRVDAMAVQQPCCPHFLLRWPTRSDRLSWSTRRSTARCQPRSMPHYVRPEGICCGGGIAGGSRNCSVRHLFVLPLQSGRGRRRDLAGLGNFILSSLDVLPHWPVIEAELAPGLSGAWT